MALAEDRKPLNSFWNVAKPHTSTDWLRIKLTAGFLSRSSRKFNRSKTLYFIMAATNQVVDCKLPIQVQLVFGCSKTSYRRNSSPKGLLKPFTQLESPPVSFRLGYAHESKMRNAKILVLVFVLKRWRHDKCRASDETTLSGRRLFHCAIAWL